MNLRRMNSKYNSRCKRCGGRIRIGGPIYWSKETGALCVSCGESGSPAPEASAAPNVPVTANADKSGKFSIDWPELKEICQTVWKTEQPPKNFRAANRDRIRTYLINVRENFTGYSRAQAERWTREGYESEALKGIHEFMPPIREKRRLRFVEEGDEFHLDLAHNGDDNFMSEWTKREVIPGIQMNFFCSLYAGVAAKVTNDFNRWICQSVFSLETVGVDAEVNFTIDGTEGPAGRGNFATTVRVKKENEATDFVSISPMLSPAGFRLFGFTACAIHAESLGNDLPSSVGLPAKRHEWSIEVERETQTINVYSPWNSYEFPADDMTKKLEDAIRQLRG